MARDVRYNGFRERWAFVEDALQIYDLAKVYAQAAGAALVALREGDVRGPRARGGAV
jgi:hypothetical protein